MNKYVAREDEGNDKYDVQFSLQGVPAVNKFVAREDDIKHLEVALIPASGRDMRRKIFVLHGLGGIGKTQLAVEFARRHQRTFSACFWLDGSTHDNVRQSIANIARRLPQRQKSEASGILEKAAEDLDATIDEVLQWLSLPENNHWLLVIDNIDRAYPSPNQDSDAFDMERYIPTADHGSVLITSRLKELMQIGASHELKRMDVAQGKKLIELRAGREIEGTVLN